MGLVYKQLVKQIGWNNVFVALLLLLTVLTSLSFYFVFFSIDGNLRVLNELGELTENQQLYKNALTANSTLGYTFLLSTCGLTSFVFIMFFYRFFRSNKKHIGCLKSLGFRDSILRSGLVLFAAVLSLTGAALGLAGGYFLSDVLINANMRTYLVTGLVKGLSPLSVIIGLAGSTIVFCITAFFCYNFVRGKEAGVLIAGNTNNARYSIFLRMANGISKIIPATNKFPFRIALRKPLAILLIIVAVMSFGVCMVLWRSLNISSQKVFDSQTTGHNYEFETRYSEYKSGTVPDNAITYLDCTANLTVGRYEIEEQTVVGLYSTGDVYELQNLNGDLLPAAAAGTVYINPGLFDTYGVNIGDILVITIDGKAYSFTVADVAVNAKRASVYVNADELAKILGAGDAAYNGILSMEKMPDGETIAKSERIEELERNAVSNNISAVINQSIGVIVGAILIFLALYVNFQDNTRDMLILHMMGYRTKNIRKLLVNVYMPILWASFLITLEPSILLAKTIQKSLSISTNDYMPFGTDAVVILIIFVLLNVIYWLVQCLFTLRIKRVIAKEEISDFVYAE